MEHAATPLAKWSGDIRKFNNGRHRTVFLYHVLFPHHTSDTTCSLDDIKRYGTLRMSIFNNFHLIDRQIL